MLTENINIISLDPLDEEMMIEIEEQFLDTELDEMCLFVNWHWDKVCDEILELEPELALAIKNKFKKLKNEEDKNELKLLITTLCVSYVEGGIAFRYGGDVTSEDISTFLEEIKKDDQIEERSRIADIFGKVKIYFSIQRSSCMNDLIHRLLKVKFENIRPGKPDHPIILDQKDKIFKIVFKD